MATRKKKRLAIDAHLYVTDVESITVRDVTGAGTQSEVVLRTRFGTLTIRLIARRGVSPRLIDMRASDRRRRRQFVQGAEVRGELLKGVK